MNLETWKAALYAELRNNAEFAHKWAASSTRLERITALDNETTSPEFKRAVNE